MSRLIVCLVIVEVIFLLALGFFVYENFIYNESRCKYKFYPFMQKVCEEYERAIANVSSKKEIGSLFDSEFRKLLKF